MLFTSSSYCLKKWIYTLAAKNSIFLLLLNVTTGLHCPIQSKAFRQFFSTVWHTCNKSTKNFSTELLSPCLVTENWVIDKTLGNCILSYVYYLLQFLKFMTVLVQCYNFACTMYNVFTDSMNCLNSVIKSFSVG